MSADLLEPRTEVLLRLPEAHDHFVFTERQAWKEKHEAEAEGAHRIATWIMRAYAGERDDPKPKDLP